MNFKNVRRLGKNKIMKQGIIKQIRDEMHGHDLQLLDLELKKLEIQRLRDGEDGAGDDPTPVNVTIHVVDASKKMPNINPTLNVPQANFLQLPNKFRAFVAGFGSGKTWVGCSSLCDKSWSFPKVPLGYFAPTYPQIRDIFFPTIDEVAFDWGLKTKIYESNKEVDLYYGRQYRSTIICRSMEKPNTIVGFKIGHALIDELDVMTKVKAQQAWRKIIARMRYKQAGLLNGIDVATTPEGFKFTHEQFVKEANLSDAKRALYGMIQASTYDNEANLPDDYIASLFESYPPQLISAYLKGQFVNLTSGAVYPDFDRTLNHTDEEIRPNEALLIGMDFNVLKMAAVVYVIRDGKPRALDELVGVRDTPTMADLLIEKFPNHEMTIIPDAAGQATSSKRVANLIMQSLDKKA